LKSGDSKRLLMIRTDLYRLLTFCGMGIDASQFPSSGRQDSYRYVVLTLPQLALSWAARVARDGKDEKTALNGGGWMYNRCWPGWQNGNPGQESQTEILGERRG
jgi:hypothetical protein